MRVLKKSIGYKVILCCTSLFLWGCKTVFDDVTPPPAVTSIDESVDQTESTSQTQHVPQETHLTQELVQQADDNEAESTIFEEDIDAQGNTYLSTNTQQTSEVVTANTSGYWLNFEDVFEMALESSKEYHALTREVESHTLLKEKEEKYYYPDATFNSETTAYYGAPSPDEDTHKFIAKLESKLYGSAVDAKIAASQQNLDAGNISLKAEEISIYYTVLRYLTKIELTREYEKKAEEYRKEIEIYYLKQVNATNEGASTQTDAMEAKLSVAEFDDSVYGIVANIEQYFKKLNEETGLDLIISEESDADRIGISYKRLKPLMAMQLPEVTGRDLIQRNAELQKIQKNLKSTLYNAEASRERFTVDVTSENYLVTMGDSKEYSVGDTDESYIQLNLEVDVYNQGMNADQKSAYKLYEAEKLRFDKQFKQYMDQYQTSLTNYNQQLTKRKKTADQVEILAGLIENQKEEIYTDQVTYKDIVESLTKLNRAQQTLLSIDLDLFDTLYDIEVLLSQKVL